MSAAVEVENLLRTIAQAASERKPLPPELRARCGALGSRVADALDQGHDVATALAGLLPEDLLAALRGPRPPLERSALLAAERLRLDRQARLVWLDTLLHPLFTMVAVAAAMAIIMRLYGISLSIPWLLAGIGVLAASVATIAIAWSRNAAHFLPSLAGLGYHSAQAQRFERAALVARWKLPEADLQPLLGSDLPVLGPVLASPDAESHCRRLADYHASAAVRARRRLAWILAAMIYVAAGILVVSSAVDPIQACANFVAAMAEPE